MMLYFSDAIVGAQFIAPFRKTTAEHPGIMNYAPTENNGTYSDVMRLGVINIAPTKST